MLSLFFFLPFFSLSTQIGYQGHLDYRGQIRLNWPDCFWSLTTNGQHDLRQTYRLSGLCSRGGQGHLEFEVTLVINRYVLCNVYNIYHMYRQLFGKLLFKTEFTIFTATLRWSWAKFTLPIEYSKKIKVQSEVQKALKVVDTHFKSP